MSNTAIYVRTSTTDQDGAAQLHALHRAAAARGWASVLEYTDLGHSGAKASRPALDALKKAARAGEVRQVMVFALDRLGRSLRDLLLLMDELTAAGCVVISLRESIDLSTPTGRLLVHLIAALAEFERELIRERVKAGIARVKATGKTRSGQPMGRPRRLVDVQAALALRSQAKCWSKNRFRLRLFARCQSEACRQEMRPRAPPSRRGDNDGNGEEIGRGKRSFLRSAAWWRRVRRG
jgi:DNA invertase Pin-like site-specific DNA recombinase